MEETKKIAENLAKEIKPNKNSATVIGLYGELGSGKTTFMKFFASSLGITETIQSPTFVIMKFYKIPPNYLLPTTKYSSLIHIDAYRLEKEEELLKLGWQKLISDPQNLICVEWADKVATIMPAHIRLKFEHGEGENQRKIAIEY